MYNFILLYYFSKNKRLIEEKLHKYNSNKLNISNNKTEDCDKSSVKYSIKSSHLPKRAKSTFQAKENIKLLQQRKIEQKLKKDIEDEEAKLKENLKKKKLREKIIKRNIILGVKNVIIDEKNENNMINFLNENDNLTKKKSEIEVFDLHFEEDMHKFSLNIVLKKFKYEIKFLFSKYSNSTNQTKKNQLFNEYKDKFQTISFSDIWLLCKDNNFNKMNISKDLILNLIRNLSKNQEQSINNSLIFGNFSKFLVSLGLHLYSDQFLNEVAGNAIELFFF